MLDDANHTQTPQRRFPEFREPWEAWTIGDFLTESRIVGNDGFAARKITVKLWGRGVFEKFESLKGSENTQYYKRRAGQFIYSKLDFLNQAFGIIPEHLDGFESTVDLPCFDISDALNPRFLLEYVQRPSFYKKHGDMADGGRKAKRIQVESFLEFPIAVPSPPEQEKVADCLTSLDEVITAQGRKLEALKAHKKGLMQQLFAREGEPLPRLRFPEFRDAGEWKPRLLGDFINERSKIADGAVPLYSLTIEDGVTAKTERYERSFLVRSKEEAYKVVLPNDFAFNPMNLRFGAIARHSGHEPVALSKYYNIFNCDDSVDSTFCHIYFRSDVMVALYDRIATGSLIEKRRVHFDRFLKLAIPFPAIAEQQRIADCVGSLDARLAAEAEKLVALKAHKKGLMQQLFPKPEGVDELAKSDSLRR